MRDAKQNSHWIIDNNYGYNDSESDLANHNTVQNAQEISITHSVQARVSYDSHALDYTDCSDDDQHNMYDYHLN